MGNVASKRSVQQSVQPASNQLAGAINDFALSLYRSIQGGQPGKNLFFSPLSISLVLAMTHLGAGGDTATQIADVFCYKQVSSENIHKEFQELIKVLFAKRIEDEERDCLLRAANKLYANSEIDCLESFLEDVKKFYGSAIEVLDDFASPAATKAINDWVAKQTEGKITDIIADGVLTSSTSLVLVNAIYFKGALEKIFKPENTKLEDFKVADDRGTVSVHLMYQQEDFPFAIDEANDCLVLEMPYRAEFRSDQFSMLIILPKADTGILELESNITPKTLKSWSSMLRTRPVKLFLPRFKLEEQYQLNKALASLGMPDAFDDSKADFQGITGDRQLYISEVIHKAFVDVNEKGTEAAAATAVILGIGFAYKSSEKPIEFRADHPFIFMIRHRQTEAILFMGHVTDPS